MGIMIAVAGAVLVRILLNALGPADEKPFATVGILTGFTELITHDLDERHPTDDQ